MFVRAPTAAAAAAQVLTLDSWISGLARPLGHTVGIAAWAFFLLFMVFGSLGFLNLMTAVFVNTLVEVLHRGAGGTWRLRS